MKRYLSVFVLAIGLLLSVAAMAAPAVDDAKLESLNQDGYTLKYDKSDEVLAKQLLPEIVKRAKNQGPSEIEQVAGKRKELLEGIASELGLKKPPKQMGEFFDQFMSAMLPFQKQVAKCRIFELGRGVEEKVADTSLFIQYDSDTKKFGWLMRYSKGSKLVEDINKLDTLTINISKEETGSDLDKALKSLDNLLYTGWCGILCHEVAECTLIGSIGLDGPFLRWFTEGVATYVAGRVTEKVIGRDAAVKFLATGKSVVSPEMVDRVDLLNWRTSSWEKDMPFTDPKVTTASYWYSTREIEELVKRHGDDTIAKICKEISRSKDKSSDQNLINAIQKATGEDIQPALAKYGSKYKDDFKGIAMKDFACRSFVFKGKKPQMGEESTTIKRIIDERQGLLIGFRYATTKAQIAGFKMSIKQYPSLSSSYHDPMVSRIAENMNLFVVPILCSDICSYEPGEYPVEILVNGKVIKEIKIKLVE